jgi:hypothetical protein
MRRPNFDGLIAFVGATIGITFGLIFALAFMWHTSPVDLNPVEITGHYLVPPQPGVDAEMHVEVFGIWGYTRTAPRWEDLETERHAWSLAAPFAVVIVGAIAGWWVGMVVSRRTRRRAARSVP